ncbi:MAG TPA: amidohydrolase [Candidatus Binatia bacterium]|jgi:predicted amidohydrolase YtcJ|nr:amidohydrolase [Candidatus Binatia bacterium]
MRTIAAVMVVWCVSLWAMPVAAQHPPVRPITVFIARKIITMDRGWPTATAVAVRDGRIVSVGSFADLRPWLANAPYTVDRTFANKVLMPGFVEAHGHPLIGGTALTRPLLSYLPIPNPYGPPFPGVKTLDAAIKKLREYVMQTKTPDETVLAWGYDTIAMGGKHPDKTALDTISTTQPILVWDASEHFVYANSAALTKYAVIKEDTKTAGIMAGPDGEPNGQFLGPAAAQRILGGALPALLQPDVALPNIKYLMDLSRQNGITTTSELAYGITDLAAEEVLFDKYFNDPASPLRCVVVSDARSMQAAKGDQAIAFVQGLPKRNTDKLIFRGVKFFADDSYLSLGMEMTNPGYTDGRDGFFNTQPDQMVDAFLPWWKAGFHIHVHTNGNAGNEATVDALAGLMAAQPRADHRFTFEHFGISTPEQVWRIRNLGGVVSVNPYYVYYRSELTAPYTGTERAFTAARLRTLVDSGVATSMHTDTPVAPPLPLEEMWIAINRRGLSGQVRGPDERISLEQAMRMVTIDAAYTLGVEELVGSIAPGKYADFAVLDQDPFDVPSEKVRNIRVWGTVLGGRVLPASEIRR